MSTLELGRPRADLRSSAKVSKSQGAWLGLLAAAMKRSSEPGSPRWSAEMAPSGAGVHGYGLAHQQLIQKQLGTAPSASRRPGAAAGSRPHRPAARREPAGARSRPPAARPQPAARARGSGTRWCWSGWRCRSRLRRDLAHARYPRRGDRSRGSSWTSICPPTWQVPPRLRSRSGISPPCRDNRRQ